MLLRIWLRTTVLRVFYIRISCGPTGSTKLRALTAANLEGAHLGFPRREDVEVFTTLRFSELYARESAGSVAVLIAQTSNANPHAAGTGNMRMNDDMRCNLLVASGESCPLQ